jgi:hypothetical protein
MHDKSRQKDTTANITELLLALVTSVLCLIGKRPWRKQSSGEFTPGHGTLLVETDSELTRA